MEKTKVELKCKSYDKVIKLIKMLFDEYVVLSYELEQVFERDESYYRARIIYEEFPF
jgi:hypothetical protein